MANRTATIDSQVHAYERNRPERPWSGFLQGPDEVTGDDMTTCTQLHILVRGDYRHYPDHIVFDRYSFYDESK